MGIVRNPESESEKELARWNRPWGSVGVNGGIVGAPFPCMMYKAQRNKNGVVLCLDHDDEQWSRQNYCVAQDERELSKLMELGWRKTQQEAIEHLHKRDKDVSTAAAHRAYEDKNMSEAARAEAAAAEAESGLHVPEVPEKPRQKRKYTRRVKPEATN